MEQPDINTALSFLHDQLSPSGINWLVIGTCSLYLQGYPVIPNDIDLLATPADAKEIAGILIHWLVDAGHNPSNKFRSNFSGYLINGVHVELMGGLEVNTPLGWALLSDHIHDPEEVVFNGRKFMVPGKTDQRKIYTLFNRDKDKQVISMLKN